MTNPARVDGQPDYSAVPAAAKSAGSRADAMMRALQEGRSPFEQPQNDAQPPTEAQQDRAPEGEASPAEAQAETPPAPPKEASPEPRPTNPTRERRQLAEPPQGEQREAAPKEQSQQPKDWEQEWRSLKGQYDRVNGLLTQARQDNDALRGIIASMEARGPATPEQTQNAVELQFGQLSEQDKADYGEDFFQKIKEYISPAFEALQRENRDLKQQLGGVQKVTAQSAEERLHAAIAAQVPDWMEINHEPEFAEWLQNHAPYTRQPKQALLLNAYKQGDASTVAQFFKDYLTDKGRVAPAQEQAPEPRRGGGPQGNGLEKFAAPGRPRSQSTGQASERAPAKQSYSSADISGFYTDVANGKYRGREEEQKRIEQDIFRAQSEGRIR